MLPVFKSRVLLRDLQTAMSSRSLAGSTTAHFWKSWDLTADELRIQSKLIKPVWSQVKNSKDKQEVNFSCKHVFWQLIFYLCGFGDKKDHSFFACFQNAPVCMEGDGSHQTLTQTQQSTLFVRKKKRGQTSTTQ